MTELNDKTFFHIPRKIYLCYFQRFPGEPYEIECTTENEAEADEYDEAGEGYLVLTADLSNVKEIDWSTHGDTNK